MTDPNPVIVTCPDGCKEMPIIRIHNSSMSPDDEDHKYFSVECSCGFSGPHRQLKLDAIFAYNRIADLESKVRRAEGHIKFLDEKITTLTTDLARHREAMPDEGMLRVIDTAIGKLRQRLADASFRDQPLGITTHQYELQAMADRIEALNKENDSK